MYNSHLKHKIVRSAENAVTILSKRPLRENLGLCNATIFSFQGSCNATIFENFGSPLP